MKFILPILLFIGIQASATNRYFSSSTGSDANACTIGSPCASITKFNSFSFVHGDSSFFFRGDTFFGTLNINQSGILGSIIWIGAYGSGAKPIITGMTLLSGWTALAGSVYSINCASCQFDLNMVTIADTLQPVVRWPTFANTAYEGYLTLQSFSGNVSITSNAIASAPNVVGGEVVIRKDHYILDRERVTTQNSTTIGYYPIAGLAQQNPIANFGFFFQNDSTLLRVNKHWGDWAYDSTSKNIYVYGDTVGVKAATLSHLVVTSQSYLTFDNLTLYGCDSLGFNIQGNNNNNITIQNCTIKNCGIDGILPLGSVGNSNPTGVPSITINNDSFLNNPNIAINANGIKNIVITNNYVFNSGMVSGMGQSGGQSYEAIGGPGTGHNALVAYNTINNSGYIGIRWQSDSALIYRNLVMNFCLRLSDGGGIYTFSDSSKYGRIVRGNIILYGYFDPFGTSADLTNPYSRTGHGLYFDNNSSHAIADSNTVAFCNYGGLEVNTGCHDLQFRNNTFYDNAVDQYDIGVNTATQTNIIFISNKLICVRADQVAALFNITTGTYANMGTLDSNYYCRPIYEPNGVTTAGTGSPYSLAYNNGGMVRYSPTADFYSLNNWVSLSSQDAHSSKTFVSVTQSSQPVSSISYPMNLYYNAAQTTSTVTLPPGTWRDVAGNSYSGTTSLIPFGSLVVFQNPLPVDPSIVSPGEYYPLIKDNYSGTVYDNLDAAIPEIAAGQPAFVSIVSGGAHDAYCASSIENGVWSVGANAAGEFGNGTLTGSSSFVYVSTDSLGNSLGNIIQILSTGNNFGAFWTVGILNNQGQVYVAGETEGGMRGDGTPGYATQKYFIKVPFPAGTFITKIQGGGGFEALDSAGNVWTWGFANNTYELARGSSPSPSYMSPGKVTLVGGTKATDIASVGGWSYAILSNGHIDAWGFYSDYITLYPCCGIAMIPQDITSVANLPHPPVHIYTNSESSYAILTDSTLWGWGGTAVGTMGTGTILNFNVTGPDNGIYAWNEGQHALQQFQPIQIAPGKHNFVNVYTGYTLSYTPFVTDSYGQLFAMGRNKSGALANGVIDCNPVNGGIASIYPDSWDRAYIGLVNPLAVTSAIQVTCPYCIANPSGTPCNTCTVSLPTKPHASATNQTVPPGQVVLNATASTSHYFNYVTWKQLTGPATAQMSVQTALLDTITLLTSGVYTFQVNLVDSTWQTDSTISTITIGASPGCGNCIYFVRPTTFKSAFISLWPKLYFDDKMKKYANFISIKY
jgi:alpha-tubulin suppressor-like RCC1 family protein